MLSSTQAYHLLSWLMPPLHNHTKIVSIFWRLKIRGNVLLLIFHNTGLAFWLRSGTYGTCWLWSLSAESADFWQPSQNQEIRGGMPSLSQNCNVYWRCHNFLTISFITKEAGFFSVEMLALCSKYVENFWRLPSTRFMTYMINSRVAENCSWGCETFDKIILFKFTHNWRTEKSAKYCLKTNDTHANGSKICQFIC